MEINIWKYETSRDNQLITQSQNVHLVLSYRAIMSLSSLSGFSRASHGFVFEFVDEEIFIRRQNERHRIVCNIVIIVSPQNTIFIIPN